MNERDPRDIAAIEDDARAKSERRRLDEEQHAKDLVKLMAETWGRRFVWRMLAEAGVFRLSFSSDALAMAFNEGGRNQGLRLVALLHQHCPQQYERMVTENRTA